MWTRSGAATMEDMTQTDVVTVRGLREQPALPDRQLHHEGVTGTQAIGMNA
jgi:hypothetical protein